MRFALVSWARRCGKETGVTATLPRPSVARTSRSVPVGGELVAGSTFDLHADVDGARWDFTKSLDRKRSWDRIRAEEPFPVVGSPPGPTLLFSIPHWRCRRRRSWMCLWPAD